jgi:acyl-CoA thioester hydrolase
VEGYRYVRPVELRFRDLDAVGHVNNVVYLTYMETARIQWWIEVTGHRDFRNFGMILARTEIDYKAPASWGDRLEVGVRCASIRRSSFVLEFRVAEPDGGRVFAEARKVLVHYDYDAGRSVPLPEALREKLKAQDPELREE